MDFHETWIFIDLDVGQNGRPRGPQMEMSSLVLTIQLLGYLILTHTHFKLSENSQISGYPTTQSQLVFRRS